jgi:hypothetical protein
MDDGAAYERQRCANINRNREELVRLGLLDSEQQVRSVSHFTLDWSVHTMAIRVFHKI